MPRPVGVKRFPLIEATAVLEEVKVQAPVEVEVGAIKPTLETLSRVKERLPKVPII